MSNPSYTFPNDSFVKHDLKRSVEVYTVENGTHSLPPPPKTRQKSERKTVTDMAETWEKKRHTRDRNLKEKCYRRDRHPRNQASQSSEFSLLQNEKFHQEGKCCTQRLSIFSAPQHLTVDFSAQTLPFKFYRKVLKKASRIAELRMGWAWSGPAQPMSWIFLEKNHGLSRISIKIQKFQKMSWCMSRLSSLSHWISVLYTSIRMRVKARVCLNYKCTFFSYIFL
jgi:hypothetical protein